MDTVFGKSFNAVVLLKLIDFSHMNVVRKVVMYSLVYIFFLRGTKNHSNSMYSPIAEASIKDLEIKDNKAMVHTEKIKIVLRLLLKEVIESFKTIT